MKTVAIGRAGSATDAGLQRNINEDRVFVDDTRGIFMVVDGLGGHAAGETAAETAVTVIEREFRAPQAINEERIANAITAANNEIYALAGANPAWRGMACVLTLAVASGDQFLVGHVGDSRLYVYWNGKLQKITSDHSPVGELEDGGALSEEQAMHHPRRNEVFRDVGSYPHSPDDPRFIELKRFRFRPDAALLLCSDGLSDLVISAEMIQIMERYDGDATRIAQLLVEAANTAGGRDNISVIFVPGPEFLGTESASLSDGRSRHGTTRMRSSAKTSRGLLRNLSLVLAGMLIGGLGLWRFSSFLSGKTEPNVETAAAPHTPQEIAVDAADSLGIEKALASALPGDTIVVPPGDYLGPLLLKDRVSIVAQSSHHVIVRSDPSAVSDTGIAIVARGIKEGRIKGLHLTGDDTHPLRIGLLIADSSIEAEDIEISGAQDAGLRTEGDSRPLVLGGNFHANSGPGVVVRGESAPRLVGNRIVENGRVTGAPKAGIEIDNDAHPSLLHNEILQNGLPATFPLALDEEIRTGNTVDAAPVKKPAAKPHPPVQKPAAKPSTATHPLSEA
jgi:serine/threonine protein phosphatase PrpC